MFRLAHLWIVGICCWIGFCAQAAEPGGLLGFWKFDEGSGEVARDSSGGRHDAKLIDPAWVKLGEGAALSFDGKSEQYVDLGPSESLGVKGPVTLEAWIKPTAPAKGECSLFGEGMRSFQLTYSAPDMCYWYVGHGSVSNYLSAQLAVGEWQHVAATFDGKQMALWINGRQVAGKRSAVNSISPGGNAMIGMHGRPELPRFAGLIDNARVFNRALSEQELMARIVEEGPAHGLVLRAAAKTSPERATHFFETHSRAIDVQEDGDSLLFANKRVALEISRSSNGFQLGRLYGIAERRDFVASDVALGFRNLFEIMMANDPAKPGKDERWNTKEGLMGIITEMSGDAFPIGSHAAKTISWRHQESETESTVHLEWKGIDVREDRGAMDVEVTVTLRADDPLSYWRINVTNRSSKYGIERVRFPILHLVPIGKTQDDVFIIPRNRGCVYPDPFNQPTGFGRGLNGFGLLYPHDMNMQFQALYDRVGGNGIFLGTRDSTVNLINLQVVNTPGEITWSPRHFPPNIRFAEENYSLPYDCVAGPFRGDWYDACQIYRQWAIKQFWCSAGPLLTRKDVPKWYKESPLYFYTHLTDSAEGTFSLDENLPIAAAHFREWVKWAGMPLGANFYGWKEYHPDLTTYNVPFNTHRERNTGRWKGMPCLNSHDGNYPKIPALHGFSEECKRLRQDGGMVSPYLCLEIFDQGPSENSPYAAEAKPNMTRDLFGAIRTWGGETSWEPCPWTKWFRDRMGETCVTMLEKEHVGGFYLDTMQGSSLPCYWIAHGHSAGGGSECTVGMQQLVQIIHDAVKAKDPDAIISGENSTENMINVIDGVLQLTLESENTAPLFATVYQDYVKRYGLEMSIGPGDAFFIESSSLFLEGSQVGMIRLRPRSGGLSFQKPEHKQMIDYLGEMVGYYRNEATRKFIAYGQLMRPLTFREPSAMPMLEYRTRQGTTGIEGQGEGMFPSLMSGVFRDADGELGVFVANAGTKDAGFKADLKLGDYQFPAQIKVSVQQIAPDGSSKMVSNDSTSAVTLEGSLAGHQITMFQIAPKR